MIEITKTDRFNLIKLTAGPSCEFKGPGRLMQKLICRGLILRAQGIDGTVTQGKWIYSITKKGKGAIL